MDDEEDWCDINTSFCYYPPSRRTKEGDEPKYFNGVGIGNPQEGYWKIVKVWSNDLNKPMRVSDFGELCDQYADWFENKLNV